MAQIQVIDDDIELDSPTLVEGFPGVGLVGKIAADHMVETLDLTHYANVHCEGIQRVAVYDEDQSDLVSPVRLYAADDGSLLVLQSDVPFSAEAAPEFADCFSPWLENNALPLFIAGRPTEERSDPPALFGVGSAKGVEAVEEADLDTPPERGVVSGPSGALLSHAVEHDLPAVGLVVEADPKFPDPIAAKVVLQDGVEKITGVDVAVDQLDEQAEQIQGAKERLAKRMQQAEGTSSEARPIRMFQ